jgi:hypothetical protein
MSLPSNLQEDIRHYAADATKERAGEQHSAGTMGLRGKATTKPDKEDASRDQNDPGQLHGEKAELVMESVLGDEVGL